MNHPGSPSIRMQRLLVRPLVLGLVLTLGASGASFAKGQDIDKVNGAIRAESGQAYGELDTVNGSIRVEGEARAESASTVNGSIRIDDGAVVGTAETVNGSITIGEGVVIEKDAETVNGALAIGRASRVEGKASTVNGRIELEQAEVGNGIETVNGDIIVGAGSSVRGGILVEKPNRGWFNWGEPKKPRIVIGADAVVEGDLVFKREVELFVHETAKVGRIEGAQAKRFSGNQP